MLVGDEAAAHRRRGERRVRHRRPEEQLDAQPCRVARRKEAHHLARRGLGGRSLVDRIPGSAQPRDHLLERRLVGDLPADRGEIVGGPGVEEEALGVAVHAQGQPAVPAARDLEAEHVGRELLPHREVGDLEREVAQLIDHTKKSWFFCWRSTPPRLRLGFSGLFA